jgi:hypothetical protein
MLEPVTQQFIDGLAGAPAILRQISADPTC